MEKMALRTRNQPFSVCVQLTVRVCEALVARSFCSRGEEGELLFVCFYIPECFCSRQRERFWILKSTIILAYEFLKIPLLLLLLLLLFKSALLFIIIVVVVVIIIIIHA